MAFTFMWPIDFWYNRPPRSCDATMPFNAFLTNDVVVEHFRLLFLQFLSILSKTSRNTHWILQCNVGVEQCRAMKVAVKVADKTPASKGRSGPKPAKNIQK